MALLRSLIPGGPALLKPETIALLMSNQLPDGVRIRSLHQLPVPGMGHGLAGAVTLQPSALDPPASTGELHWGGIAGTHWWISPRTRLAGVLMTQRAFGFWHPCAFESKRLMYEGEMLNSKTLFEWGFLDRVCPSARLEKEALAYAAKLATQPREVVAAYQEIFRALRQGDTDKARELRLRAKARAA